MVIKYFFCNNCYFYLMYKKKSTLIKVLSYNQSLNLSSKCIFFFFVSQKQSYDL